MMNMFNINTLLCTQYEQDDDITEFVDELIPLLNTPDKLRLLNDVRYTHSTILITALFSLISHRSVLSPAHLVVFDEMVSPLEVEAMNKSSDTESGSSDEGE